MVVGEGARLSTGGIVIGIAAAFALTRLVSGLLHGVAPADPLSFFIFHVALPSAPTTALLRAMARPCRGTSVKSRVTPLAAPTPGR